MKSSASVADKATINPLSVAYGNKRIVNAVCDQPSGGYSGQAKDMTIHTKHSVRMWDSLNALYSNHTGQSKEIIEKIMDKDYFMTPEEAKEFGIIDEGLMKELWLWSLMMLAKKAKKMIRVQTSFRDLGLSGIWVH
ncbi:hypothetical protein ACLB2K_042083 [Fragaria x ananassa]